MIQSAKQAKSNAKKSALNRLDKDPSKLGYCAHVAATILVVLNVLLLIVGFIIGFGGLAIYYLKDGDWPWVIKYKDKLMAELQDATGVDTKAAEVHISAFMGPFAKAMMVAGGIISTFAGLGFTGTWMKNRRKLIYYVTLVFILLVMTLILTILMDQNPPFYEGSLKTRMKETLDHYSGLLGSDSYTLCWNGFMTTFKCCGMNSYRDFINLPKWPPKTLNNYNTTNLKTPVICCKNTTAVQRGQFECASIVGANSTSSNMHTGCYSQIVDALLNLYSMSLVIHLALGIQSLLVVCSMWLLVVDSRAYFWNSKLEKDKRAKEKIEKDRKELIKMKEENVKMKAAAAKAAAAKAAAAKAAAAKAAAANAAAAKAARETNYENDTDHSVSDSDSD